MSNTASKKTETADFLEPAREPDELGRLGPYRVLGILGSGGMGQVFHAEDVRLQRPVALKIMNARFAAKQNSRRRFLDEARAMAAVRHDNVVTIYEVGEQNDTPYMAMELLEGQTLEHSLKKGDTYDYQEILHITEQLCHGLNAAHARNIVHRDLKPANIWLESPDGRPKLLDFGLALASSPVDRVAGSGAVTGTPGYLSPEQARSEPLDNRSDLYSLGVVLFEMCTGQLPVISKPIHLMLIAVISHTPKLVSDLNPDIPLPVADLINRLLAKEPRIRPRSALQLVDEIGNVLAQCEADQQSALQVVTDFPSGKAETKERPEKKKQPDSHHKRKKPVQERPSHPPLWRKALPWVTSFLALCVTLPLVASLRVPEKKTVAVAPEIKTKQEKKRKTVTAASLAPLEIEDLSVFPNSFPVGQKCAVKFRLANQAVDAEQDPRKINRGIKLAVKLRFYLKTESGDRQKVNVFPLRYSASQLPKRGETLPRSIQFDTSFFTPGRYRVIVAIETPKRILVSEYETAMTLEPK